MIMVFYTHKALRGHDYKVGYTRRHSEDPVRHAATSYRTAGPRSSFAALCGAAMGAWSKGNDYFDPEHERACVRCAESVRDANR